MLMDDKDKKNKKPIQKANSEAQPEEPEATEKLIEAALRSHLLKYSDKKIGHKKSIHHISGLVHEHLSSFIVVGYNYDGDPMSVTVANTRQETDALCTLMHKFILQNSGELPM